ncbi:MAG TPA: hypothetical protein EYQ25_01960 [Planctomycetes bacterium]|nr:hypothetical protein [Planctomycetota bacterium]HIL37150.1 hypothetical protein [Planctomycetota bacterium]
MTRKRFQRRRKLIKPSLQLKLTAIFTGLCALSLLLQFILFQSALTSAALELPADSARMLDLSQSIVLKVLAISFLVCLPLTFLVGIMTTFRFAGPVWRFETFLKSILRGEKPQDFTLRKGDQLTELAELLVRSTRPLRADSPQAAPATGTPTGRPSVPAGLRKVS